MERTSHVLTAVVLVSGEAMSRVAGVPLIIRTLILLKRQGIGRFVVTGSGRLQEIRHSLGRDRRLQELDIAFVPRSPGTTACEDFVATSRLSVKGDFLVVPTDRLFESGLLAEACGNSARPEPNGAVLWVDRWRPELGKADSLATAATDVSGRVLRIDAAATGDAAILTGIVRVGEEAFAPLCAGQPACDRCTLSDGLQRLAVLGRLKAAWVTDAWWQVIAGPADVARAEDHIFQSCRKPIDGPADRYVNRYLSLFLSRRLKDLPISPNAISIVTLVMGILAGAAATGGTYGWFLLAATCFQVNSILDCVDGELARARLQQSLFGAWLDTVADDVSNFLFFLGLTIGVWRLPGGPLYAVAGGVACACQFLFSAVVYRQLADMGLGDLNAVPWGFNVRREESTVNRVLAVLFQVVRKDFFILTFLVLAVFGVLPWALYLGGLGGAACGVAAVGRWFRASRTRACCQQSDCAAA